MLLTGAILLVSGSMAAETPSQGEGTPYTLHYIVFQHQGFWDDPLRIHRVDRPRHQSPREAPSSEQETASQAFEALWEELDTSPRYRPLLRGRIERTLLSQTAAAPLDLISHWPASIHPAFAALSSPVDRAMRHLVGSCWDTGNPSRQWALESTHDWVRGTLTLYKGRYIHLTVDLLFAEGHLWMPWGLDRRYYVLQRSRRLQPGQYYYFDHPRFGLLTRIERPD